MIFLKRLITIAAICSGLAAPVLAEAVTIPVDDHFNDLSLKWNGGQITSYIGVWDIRVDDAGFIMVCGAGQMKDANSAQATLAWLHSIFIKLDGVKILKDMSFFTKVKAKDDVRAVLATCKSSKTPAPQRSFDVELSWPAAQAKF